MFEQLYAGPVESATLAYAELTQKGSDVVQGRIIPKVGIFPNWKFSIVI